MQFFLRTKYSWIVLILLYGTSLSAQSRTSSVDTTKFIYRTAKWINNMAEKGFLIVPVASYSPETRISVGVGGYSYFRFNAEDSITRPSSVTLVAIYTQNKQAVFQMPAALAFDQNKYLLNIDPTLARYPYRFYGVGNEVRLDSSELYTADIARMKVTLLRQIKPNIFAGPMLRFEHQSMRKLLEGGRLAQGDVLGSGGGNVWGVGGEMLFDFRNNIFTPTKGTYFSVQGYRLMGSYQGTNIVGDLRKYFPVGQKSSVAWQAYWSAWSGNPPFYLLSRMGGYYRMRGYFEGALRDKHFMQTQVEYRFPLFWRLGATVFTSLGQVNDRAAIERDHLRVAGGIGLRFLFNTQENINLRIDYARGRGTSGFYLTVAEAF